MLVVPTTAKHGKVPMGAVQLDASPRWRNNHWRSIRSAYENAPFFEYYSDALHAIMFQQHRFLFDFNKSLLSFCLRSLNLEIAIAETVSYQQNYPPGVIDHRNVISNKTNHAARTRHRTEHYQQVFGSNFVANLSVVDVLFCTGPNANRYIKTSAQE